MKNYKSLFFAGVDWGKDSHQVCVIDREGSLIAQRSFKHSGVGFFEMAQWMMKVSESEAFDIAVAIEVNHGPVVETLLEQGFEVYSVNPKQLDRFRDRFCVSGAKDDRRDAQVPASALRTDRSSFRSIEPQDPDVIVLRELNKTRQELVAERVRCINRFRELLWRYYPQFTEILDKEIRAWHLELWELIPCPDSTKRKRVSTVQSILKRNRVKRLTAEEVLSILRAEKINVSEATIQSCVRHIKMIIERMKVIDRQLEETEDSIKQAVESMNSKLKAEGEGPTDIEILMSIPGVGPAVLTAMIASAWSLVRGRDLDAIRCLGGTAPVTRQSGKTKQVIMRRAVCETLSNAFHVLGGIAAIHDPVSKAKYEELKAKGHNHSRSARTVCDRILSVACTILKKGELFDKEFREPLGNVAEQTEI